MPFGFSRWLKRFVSSNLPKREIEKPVLFPVSNTSSEECPGLRRWCVINSKDANTNALVHKHQQECCRLSLKQSQHLRGNDPWWDQHSTLTHNNSKRLNIIIFMATTTTTTATTFIITFAIRDWPARVAGDGPIVLHFCRRTSTNTTNLGNQRNEKV